MDVCWYRLSLKHEDEEPGRTWSGMIAVIGQGERFCAETTDALSCRPGPLVYWCADALGLARAERTIHRDTSKYDF